MKIGPFFLLLLLEMPPVPCVFVALMCQSGLVLTDSRSINQTNSVLCHTLPHSFIAQEGAGSLHLD